MSKLSSWDIQKAAVQEFCNRNGLNFLCREEEVRCGFPLKDKLGFFYSSGFDTCEIDLTEVKEEKEFSGRGSYQAGYQQGRLDILEWLIENEEK